MKQRLFDAIEHITPLEVVQSFGLEIRNGRTRCPFHNGHDNNMSFKKGAKYCRCFVCAKSWGAVSLYAQLSGIENRIDAAKSMAASFGVQYDETDDYEHRRAAIDAKEKRDFRKRLVEKGKHLFNRRFDALCKQRNDCIDLLTRYGHEDQDSKPIRLLNRELDEAERALDEMLESAPTDDDDYIEYAKRWEGC